MIYGLFFCQGMICQAEGTEHVEIAGHNSYGNLVRGSVCNDERNAVLHVFRSGGRVAFHEDTKRGYPLFQKPPIHAFCFADGFGSSLAAGDHDPGIWVCIRIFKGAHQAQLQRVGGAVVIDACAQHQQIVKVRRIRLLHGHSPYDQTFHQQKEKNKGDQNAFARSADGPGDPVSEGQVLPEAQKDQEHGKQKPEGQYGHLKAIMGSQPQIIKKADSCKNSTD